MPRTGTQRTRKIGVINRNTGQVMRQHRDIAAGAIAEEGHARRRDVYRDDVEFAKPLPSRLPMKGTQERRNLVRQIVKLRDAGWTYAKIMNELDVAYGSMSQLIYEGRNHGEENQ